MDIHLIRDNELFGVAKQEDVDNIYKQLENHPVLEIPLILVRPECKEWLKDDFTLVFIQDGEIIEGKIAYITSYREVSTTALTVAEKCTVVTRNPGEQVKRAEASITL
jgi:hypothetical protein